MGYWVPGYDQSGLREKKKLFTIGRKMVGFGASPGGVLHAFAPPLNPPYELRRLSRRRTPPSFQPGSAPHARDHPDHESKCGEAGERDLGHVEDRLDAHAFG